MYGNKWNKCYYIIDSFDRENIESFLEKNEFINVFLGSSVHPSEFQSILFINIYKYLASTDEQLQVNEHNMNQYPFMTYIHHLLLQQSQLQTVKESNTSNINLFLFSLILANLSWHYLKSELDYFNIYNRDISPDFSHFVDMNLLEQTIIQARFIKHLKKQPNPFQKIIQESWQLTKELDSYISV